LLCVVKGNRATRMAHARTYHGGPAVQQPWMAPVPVPGYPMHMPQYGAPAPWQAPVPIVS
jgi:hypothetical protein